MKRYRIRTAIALENALLVCLVIALVAILSNLLIRRQFENYVKEQQQTKAEELAQHLATQYDSTQETWNLEFIHGMGMYALSEGYMIELSDNQNQVLWDAQNHDMTMCHQMMQEIQERMERERPDLEGEFVTTRYPLLQSDTEVGYLDVSYYSPFYMSDYDFQFIHALNQILVLVSIFSIAAAVILGIIMTHSMIRPINRMVDMTEKISEGDYHGRIQGPVHSKEMYGLTQSINQMAEALEQQEALRKRLLSDIVHELRTPIAGVTAYLEAFLEKVWEPTPKRLGNCYDELKRMSLLITDMEQLHQVEDENLKLKKEWVDLLELSRQVKQFFESQFMNRGLTCIVEGVASSVYADRERLQQVLVNLVSNAIKYTPTGGKIQILVENRKDEGVLSVCDTGVGISREDQRWIFERFYRVDKSRSRRTGGAGIGLSIVKSIVHAHGGTIFVESQIGKGSRFTVILPKEAMGEQNGISKKE